MHHIYAIFPSKKDRDAFWSFLTQYDFSLLECSEKGSSMLLRGEDMGFTPRKGGTIIGISGDTLPQKAWALMAWIAHHNGAPRAENQHKDIDQNDTNENIQVTWPILFFDDEKIPVVVSETIHGEDVLYVDPNGILNSWIERDLPEGPQHDVQRKFMHTLQARYLEFIQKSRKKTK